VKIIYISLLTGLSYSFSNIESLLCIILESFFWFFESTTVQEIAANDCTSSAFTSTAVYGNYVFDIFF
jgi:hypothetical protein